MLSMWYLDAVGGDGGERRDRVELSTGDTMSIIRFVRCCTGRSRGTAVHYAL